MSLEMPPFMKRTVNTESPWILLAFLLHVLFYTSTTLIYMID